MERHRGYFLERYGHPNISVDAGSAYRAGAEWIVNYLEEQIRGGTVFRSGETIQIGWLTVLLGISEGSDLELLEPNFDSVPVKWVLGVNNTVRHLTIQKEVCDQVAADAYYPSMQQSGIVSPNFLCDHQVFELSRDDIAGNDSGWVFREEGYLGSNGAHCSLYQVASAVPKVVPFLALPCGSTVKRTRTDLEVSTTHAKISSTDNAFLKRLLRSAFFSNAGT